MTTTPSDGGLAFPIDGDSFRSDYLGMSLRDHFAGLAMQGLILVALTESTLKGLVSRGKNPYEVIVERAYGLADAMIAERAKGSTP